MQVSELSTWSSGLSQALRSIQDRWRDRNPEAHVGRSRTVPQPRVANSGRGRAAVSSPREGERVCTFLLDFLHARLSAALTRVLLRTCFLARNILGGANRAFCTEQTFHTPQSIVWSYLLRAHHTRVFSLRTLHLLIPDSIPKGGCSEAWVLRL